MIQVPKTLNPIFNDIFERTVIDINTVVAVKLELYDADDIGTDDFLGYTQIDLPATNAYNFMKKFVSFDAIQSFTPSNEFCCFKR